jgi:hypothetical protein
MFNIARIKPVPGNRSRAFLIEWRPQHFAKPIIGRPFWHGLVGHRKFPSSTAQMILRYDPKQPPAERADLGDRSKRIGECQR